MSGSPKYAPVRLSPARRAQLEAERRRRIEERRRTAEERARRAVERYGAKLAARAVKIQERQWRTQADAAALADRITSAVGLTDQQRSAMAARANHIGNRADGAAAAVGLRTLEHDLAVAEGRSAAASATAERTQGLDSIVTLLATVEDRLRFDANGARQVDGLVTAAKQALHDPRRFQRAQAALADQVNLHLTAVERGRATFEKVELAAEKASASLDALVAEAEAAGVELAGQAEAQRLRERLAADLAADLVVPAQNGLAALDDIVERMEAEVETLLDDMYATELVIQAAADALPAVGFQVVRDSMVQSGASIAFQVQRTDGALVQVRIDPEDEGARLSYEGTASDYVLERGPDGIVARCDLTEQLLEQFHAELAEHGIEAGELQWEGKPTRPKLRGAKLRDRVITEGRRRP